MKYAAIAAASAMSAPTMTAPMPFPATGRVTGGVSGLGGPPNGALYDVSMKAISCIPVLRQPQDERRLLTDWPRPLARLRDKGTLEAQQRAEGEGRCAFPLAVAAL